MRTAKETGSKTGKVQSLPFMVNGLAYQLEVGDRPDQVDSGHTPAQTLRGTLGLTGTKIGCDQRT